MFECLGSLSSVEPIRHEGYIPIPYQTVRYVCDKNYHSELLDRFCIAFLKSVAGSKSRAVSHEQKFEVRSPRL
jgi:hypothetical protein